MNDIISNCPLCEEHGLHLVGEEDSQIMQCIWCGYVSSPKFVGKREDNEEYQKLNDDMKGWSKEELNRIWIPSMFTLPDGMIYPIDVEEVIGDGVRTVMKWAFAGMVDIPEEEQKNYPVGDGSDKFYEKMYDIENAIIYDNFYEVMSKVNEMAKNKVKKGESKEVKIKLPKLSRG